MTTDPLAALRHVFPDYPVSSLPALPAGFVPSFGRNDVCPNFTNWSLGPTLWIDYPDPTAH